MEETTVCAQFILIGDESFNPDIVTNTLAVQPTEIGRKGELIRNGRLKRRESFWEINTGYEQSHDINDQLGQLLDIIFPLKKKLKNIISNNSIHAKFGLVIKIEDGQTPAMYLKQNIIDLMSEIGIVIDFDTYVLSA